MTTRAFTGKPNAQTDTVSLSPLRTRAYRHNEPVPARYERLASPVLPVEELLARFASRFDDEWEKVAEDVDPRAYHALRPGGSNRLVSPRSPQAQNTRGPPRKRLGSGRQKLSISRRMRGLSGGQGADRRRMAGRSGHPSPRSWRPRSAKAETGSCSGVSAAGNTPRMRGRRLSSTP